MTCNGYRSRQWDTRVGTMELRIPKLREGSYFPSLLEPSEKALLAVVQQAYVEGVSTRRVDDLVKALGCDASQRARCRVSAGNSTVWWTASLIDRWMEDRTATCGWTR